MEQEVFDQLEAIYRELEEELQRLRPLCRLSGACCHFAKAGHRLYTSEIEWRYLVHHAGMPKVLPAEEVCPYLKDRHCTAREHRMLGCRVYFCDSSYASKMPEIYEKYHREIRSLTSTAGMDWSYFDFSKRMRSEVSNGS